MSRQLKTQKMFKQFLTLNLLANESCVISDNFFDNQNMRLKLNKYIFNTNGVQNIPFMKE